MQKIETRRNTKLASKSIQFPAAMLGPLDGLAKQVGFTHIQHGETVGNISRIVLELVEFALLHTGEFLKWKMGGKK